MTSGTDNLMMRIVLGFRLFTCLTSRSYTSVTAPFDAEIMASLGFFKAAIRIRCELLLSAGAKKKKFQLATFHWLLPNWGLSMKKKTIQLLFVVTDTQTHGKLWNLAFVYKKDPFQKDLFIFAKN